MEALAVGAKQHRCDLVLLVRLSSTSQALAQSVAVHLRDPSVLHRRQLDFNRLETALAVVIPARMALVRLGSERIPHRLKNNPPDLSINFTSAVNIKP